MNADSEYLLELREITRTFPCVIANNRVNLVIRSGEIHALLGENGAGKSTLVKMIYGILQPDSGSIFFNGKKVLIDGPARARELGIAMVFQHFSLFESLSVVENILLGLDKTADKRSLSDKINEISNKYGLPINPNRHVYTLSVGERQRVEIIRCLLQHPRLLIMDEPTSVLTPQEVDKLFVTLRQLADEQVSILYISHKLEEIRRLCRRASILRLGRMVDTVDVAGQSASSLAAMMMGEDLQQSKRKSNRKFGETRLKVTGLNLAASDATGIPLTDVNIEVKSGEIVGIAGVAGNGQEELLQALNGEKSCQDAASVIIGGIQAGKLGPNSRRKAGLASVPEKRLGHGAIPDMNLVDNAFMTGFQRMGLLFKGLINYGKTKNFADQVISGYSVKTPDASAQAQSLSGGNLQKFIIGRELTQQPRILIISQPTWGVDAGAAQTIHQALRDLAGQGAAVLIISQDIDELMSITDRIGAICGGRVSAFYPTSEMNVEKIGLLMAGADLEGR